MERGKTGEGGILRGGCGEREKRREDAKRMEVWRNPEFDLRLFLKATWGKALVFLSAKPLPSSVRLLREKQILDQYITWSSVLFLDVTSLTSLQKNEGGAHWNGVSLGLSMSRRLQSSVTPLLSTISSVKSIQTVSAPSNFQTSLSTPKFSPLQSHLWLPSFSDFGVESLNFKALPFGERRLDPCPREGPISDSRSMDDTYDVCFSTNSSHDESISTQIQGEEDKNLQNTPARASEGLVLLYAT